MTAANKVFRGPPASNARDPNSSFTQRFALSETWRYSSANLLLLLGSAAILAGGWVPWLVLAVAMVLGSFADEVGGDDRTTLDRGSCWFCKINLYLSLPLVCLLAAALIRFAATLPSLTGKPFELIGVLWLSGYLFALVGATVAHELCHRTGRIAKLVAYALLGFTGNASFVTYHLYAHHRQVGTLDDAATARRGERRGQGSVDCATTTATSRGVAAVPSRYALPGQTAARACGP